MSETHTIFKSIGVVGAGQMGSGIAQVLATYGLSVVVHDLNETVLSKAQASMEKSISKLIEKGKIRETTSVILGRIKFSSSLEDLAKVELAIEAASENKEIKKIIFRKLDALLAPTAVLASNTSSISITELAAATKRPKLVLGVHFMNPVPLMKLVEVVRGQLTDDSTVNRVATLLALIEKQTIFSKDYAGFIVNRILMPMLNEAMFTLYEGVGTAEDIDKGMKLGTNHPMGPLELADFIGLDTCLSILEVLYDGFKDPKYRPCPLLKNYVMSGLLGKKTGRGFYDYSQKAGV
ncbi:MAG: 3-hydroxybutyryl-CoA dehydrogenase [Bacteriovoracaceae bacterium]|nr:3-hydroxybutyryl-CoA dehydrogenase [Bacteriovoracaceae bacterium]